MKDGQQDVSMIMRTTSDSFEENMERANADVHASEPDNGNECSTSSDLNKIIEDESDNESDAERASTTTKLPASGASKKQKASNTESVVAPRGLLQEPGGVAVTPGTTSSPTTSTTKKSDSYKKASQKQTPRGWAFRPSSQVSVPGAVAVVPGTTHDSGNNLRANSDSILMQKHLHNRRANLRQEHKQATSFPLQSPDSFSTGSVHETSLVVSTTDGGPDGLEPPRLLAEKHSLGYYRKNSREPTSQERSVSRFEPAAQGSFVSTDGATQLVSSPSMDARSLSGGVQSTQESEPGTLEYQRPTSLRSSLRSSLTRRTSLEQDERKDATLVNATLVEERDDSPVYAAEAVPEERIRRRRRRVRAAGVILIGALITTIVLVTTKPRRGDDDGSNGSKCQIPLEEQKITTQCACQGEISMISRDALEFGDVMLNLLVDSEVLPFNFRENFNETSCLPENQALWWIADPNNVDIPRDSFEQVVLNRKFEHQIIQRYVLGLLYLSMGGKQWTRQANWLSTAPACTWFGLVCTEASRLALLELPANELSGSIPIQIGNLLHLQSINFSGNQQLTGSLPSEVSKIRGLRSLKIKNTGLSGEIPVSLKENEVLTTITLFNNSLSGVFPSEVAQLPLLQIFDVANNQFTGSLPTEIGKMTNLGILGIDNNDFTGEIPSEIGNAQSLQIIKATNNRFGGTIPNEVGNLKFLGDLELMGNNFTGQIPSSFANLTRLSLISISTNLAQGFVAKTLCDTLDMLEAIFLDCNDTQSFCSCCFCKESELGSFTSF